MSRSPRIVEVSVVTSSGADVPIAITVSPMIASLTSSDRAISIDPSTRSSAPKHEPDPGEQGQYMEREPSSASKGGSLGT